MPDSGTREPVSCYVCGHPVLEGQRSWPRVVEGEGVEHANPADHLPTLGYRVGVLAAEEKAHISELSKRVATMNERERAAQWVEKARDECQSDTHIQIFDMLIDRIRSGE